MILTNSLLRSLAPTLAAGALLLAGCDRNKTPDVRCLAAGTQIVTPRGAVAIEDLVLGDLVYSVDPASGARIAAKVVLIRQAHRRCLRMKFDHGVELCTTADHPFFSPQTSRYQRAERWCEALTTVPLSTVYHSTADGELTPRRVVSCVELPGELRVFDIGVDSKHHNFLAEGVVVHNKTVKIELDLPGRWGGFYISDSKAVSGSLEMQLTRPADGLVAGTATFGSQTCMGRGVVEATSYNVLQGTIRVDGHRVRIEARLDRTSTLIDRIRGSYVVEEGATCLGGSGRIELLRNADPADPNDPVSQPIQPIEVFELEEGGGWRHLGTGFYGK